MNPRYRFRTVWTLDAPPEDLFEILLRLDEYDRWWPQIRSVQRLHADAAALEIRSVLPVTIAVTAERSAVDRARGVLEGRLRGDLVGWSRWRIRPAPEGAHVFHEQDVVVAARWRRAALVARPLFLLNHAALMRNGRRALHAHWRGQAGAGA